MYNELFDYLLLPTVLFPNSTAKCRGSWAEAEEGKNKNITCTSFLSLRCFKKRVQHGDCRVQQGAVPEADRVKSLSAAQAGVCSSMLSGKLPASQSITSSLTPSHPTPPTKGKAIFNPLIVKLSFPTAG